MAECARCGDFTDNSAEGEYHYCEDCLGRFGEVESSGVVIEQGNDGEHHVIVTDDTASLDGGTEQSQVDALARGKCIVDECGLEAVFKYDKT
ncbi:hypothetical protein [Halomicrobium urmianum]|uniref:hypothetical protein n=1 Tax=Halomicrobium urmianum TaxID=1586233 RepID=UPI001CD94D56|nr:hypothetical protein [Halomicrobium urmianum]